MNSMSTHTPGPWTQAPLSLTSIVTGDNEAWIATAREGVNGIERDEAIANARLIAAAPELLMHLQRLVRAIDRAPANFADGLADEARAAIAKAGGAA